MHEHIVATGPVGHLDNDMLHFAFPKIHAFVEKDNRYSNWEAAVQYKDRQGETADIGGTLSGTRKLKNRTRRLPFRPTLRFIYAYFLRGGFLDGQPGYVFCRLLSMYEFLSVAKFTEMKRRENDDQRMKSLSAVPARQ